LDTQPEYRFSVFLTALTDPITANGVSFVCNSQATFTFSLVLESHINMNYVWT